MPPATSAGPGARARDQLVGLLGPVVTAAGYDLEDVTVASAGRRSVVRVIVDADGGVDLDAIAEISRLVSVTLDTDPEADRVLRGAYVLEVSSPGVDRPLTEPRHWRRASGRLVRVELAGVPVTGRIRGADESGLRLDVDGRERTEPWRSVGSGRVQVEFNRPGATDADSDVSAEDDDVEGEE